MTTALPGVSWQVRLRAVLFGLLCLNTVIYLRAGTPNEALDSLAWLTLLSLFALETSGAERWRRPRVAGTIRAMRLTASAALVVALAGYARDAEWLDVANVALWVALVAVLELEVRRPALAGRYRVGYAATARALYAGLAAVAAVWLWRGDWFGAYDAALWMFAFATLELDVLRVFRRDAA